MTSPSSSTMRAAVLDAAGQPFRIAELTRPCRPQGQVLVRIHASGVNPLDTKIRAGQAAHAQQPLPSVLGHGPGRRGRGGRPGRDEVQARRRGLRHGRRHRRAAGHAGRIRGGRCRPDRAEAAQPGHARGRRLPLVFITAYEGLVDRAKTQAGQTVLVHGGAGGVGHMAVQLAKSLGARVFATGSRRRPKPSGASARRRSTTRRPRSRTMSRGTRRAKASTWCTTRSAARCSMPRSRPRAATAAMWSAASAGARTSWRRCRSARRPTRACSRCCR
jgi:hypothetical protein